MDSIETPRLSVLLFNFLVRFAAKIKHVLIVIRKQFVIQRHQTHVLFNS